MNRPIRWVVLALLGVLAMGVQRVRADGVVDDHWYAVEMQGQRCGHMHAQTVQVGDRFTSTSEMKMEIKRGESAMLITIATEFVETAAGKPVKMRSETRLGALPTVDEFLFKPDGVEVTHAVAGSRHTEKKALPEGEWMTPMAIERYVTGKIAAGEKEISVRAIEPSAGLTPATTTMRLIERTTLEVIGKTVPAIKWSSKNELMPKVDSTEFTDDRGVPLRTETDIGGIKITLIKADKALALSKASAPELLESTFIIPDKQIKDARQSTVGVFLARAEGVKIDEWPSAGVQTVEKVDEHTLRIRVDTAKHSRVSKVEMDAPEFRKASSMVNSDDSKVIEIKDRALKGHEKDANGAKAEMLRKFVAGYITKKNFDVGFASAAETARTRCGDCTEHAVLLCALLRSADIPARCVSGLVYADGIGKGGKGAMGYHLWTQAMLESGGGEGEMRWVDLDAALDDSRPIDATHLAIQTLGLADGQTINALIDILPTLGKLKISVEKVEGRTPPPARK